MKKFLFLFLLLFQLPCLFCLDYVVIKQNEQYGLASKQLEVLLNPTYRSIDIINEYIFLRTFSCIYVLNSKLEQIDYIKAGKADFFKSVEYCRENYYIFHGYACDCLYNIKNGVVSYMEGIAPNSFNEEMSTLLPIYTRGYYYSYETQKKYLDTFSFEFVYPFINGRAVVVDNDYKKSIIDENGNVIIGNIINTALQYKDDMIPVITETDSGFIDRDGNFVFKCPIYDENKKNNPGGIPALWCVFSEGYAYVPVSDRSWIIFKDDGSMIKEVQYKTNSQKGFSEGFLPIINGKTGYINTVGTICIPFVFDNAEDFKNNYACVVFKGEDAVLDKKGNVYFIKDLLKGNKKTFTNVLD